MIYAMNLFNFVEGKEDAYREYSKKAGKLILNSGGRIVCSGYQPIRHLKSDNINRSNFIIVEFPDENTFNKFYSISENEAIHQLREIATCDYIWTIFQNWDLKRWVIQQATRKGQNTDC